MGWQQLLLIIVVVIVIGIAVAIGISMFGDSAISSNRDAVTSDLVDLASRARQFYRRPAAVGGGGESFTGLTADSLGLAKLTSKQRNANGIYSIQTAGNATQVVLKGVGNERADGIHLVEVWMTVTPDTSTPAIKF